MFAQHPAHSVRVAAARASVVLVRGRLRSLVRSGLAAGGRPSSAARLAARGVAGAALWFDRGRRVEGAFVIAGELHTVQQCIRTCEAASSDPECTGCGEEESNDAIATRYFARTGVELELQLEWKFLGPLVGAPSITQFGSH